MKDLWTVEEKIRAKESTLKNKLNGALLAYSGCPAMLFKHQNVIHEIYDVIKHSLIDAVVNSLSLINYSR